MWCGLFFDFITYRVREMFRNVCAKNQKMLIFFVGKNSGVVLSPKSRIFAPIINVDYSYVTKKYSSAWQYR